MYLLQIFSARCNIYIFRLCYDVSVRLSVYLSVTEVHWRIIANLGFKFRSNFTAHCGRGEGSFVRSSGVAVGHWQSFDVPFSLPPALRPRHGPVSNSPLTLGLVL